MKKLQRIVKMEVMENNSYLSLLQKIPGVLRVRGYRLYLTNGQRLVDLWLNGGAAILGHTPPNFLRELKNTASRGLFAPYPHFTESRFLKALFKLLPGYSFRIYAAPPQELAALFNSGEAKLWRPYADSKNPFAVDDTPFIIPVLPGIQTWRDGLPLGLCIAAANSEAQLSQLPPNDSLSPVLLALAARGVYDLLAAPDRAKPKLPRLTKVLNQSRWQRQGIYLTLKEKVNNEEWSALFQSFLEDGFLLPPTQAHPLILPGELSQGEEAKLASLL